MSGSSSRSGSGRRHTGPLDDLTRGTWGRNDRGTIWVPPQWAGVDVDVNLLAAWMANPCQVDLVESEARNKHAVVNRRGGKTNGMGAASSVRSFDRAEALIAGADPHPSWTPKAFDAWTKQVIGEPGHPERIHASRLLKRLEWPIPCIGGAPEAELCNLQRAELAKHFNPWADELGAFWIDGDTTLVVLGLGIIWRFQTFERAVTKVGTGNVVLWITEAARCKATVWEHVLPSLADRQGSLFTDTTPWGGRDPNGYWGRCVIRANEDEARIANTHADPPTESAYFHWEPEDNYAIPSLVDEMERDVRLYGANSAYVLRTWRGSWDTPEGACWPTFDKRRHSRRLDPREFDLWIGGYDHGFGEHPLCCLVLGLTRKRPRHAHIFAGLYGDHIWVTPPDEKTDFKASNTVVGFLLRTMEKIRVTNPDARLQGYGAPERPESWSALTRQPHQSWITAEYVRVGGIEDVGALFASDRLTMEPDIDKRIVRDIQGARWAKDTGGRDLPTFDKKQLDPHAGEALVYAIQGISNVLDLASFTGRGFVR